MFKQSKHRQHDPETGQKGRGGVRAVPFHLAAAESDQDRLQFRGLRCVVCLQLPDHHAGHRRDKQAAGDGRSGLLLPLFQLLAVALEQFEEAFNSPPPVVTTSQVFCYARSSTRWSAASIRPAPFRSSHGVGRRCTAGTVVVRQLGIASPLTFFLAGRSRITFCLRHPQLGGLAVIARFVGHFVERLALRKRSSNLTQENRLAEPTHSAIIGPHEELEPFGIPLTEIVYRVRFAVDDVQQRLVQVPPAARLHRRQNLIQMGHDLEALDRAC